MALGVGNEVFDNVVLKFLLRIPGAIDVPAVRSVRHDNDQPIARGVLREVRQQRPIRVVTGVAVQQIEHGVSAGGGFVVERQNYVHGAVFIQGLAKEMNV